MIVLSLVLVLASAGLLVTGLAEASHLLIWTSIGASLVAALCLAVSVVQRRNRGEAVEAEFVPAMTDPVIERVPERVPYAPSLPAAGLGGTRSVEARTTESRSGESRSGESWSAPEDAAPEDGSTDGGHPPDPPDEPAEEDSSASDVLRVQDLIDEVQVVDGRPRYHLAECRHLLDKEAVPLPIADARESGFTPCALCAPDRHLAAAARGTAD